MPRRSSKVDPELIELLHEAVLAGKMEPGDATQVMRRKEALSQAHLARRARVSLRTVQRLESGKGGATLAELKRIAATFGLGVGFMQISVRFGTEEIVEQRRQERLANLRAVKEGRATLKELHERNAIRVEPGDLKVGLPRLSLLRKRRKQR